MQMRTALFLFLLTSAFLNVSCAPSASVDSRAADAAAIQALDEQWSATAARNDLAGTVAFYADDAVLLPGNAPIAKDQKSIRASWAGLLGPNTVVSWKVSKVEVAKSGELGYLYGTYELSIKDAKGGPPVRDIGKLVEIWKKQADGKWKCIVDTYNSDLPVPDAPEAKK
jgi:ketosteroid isomerase-like protein